MIKTLSYILKEHITNNLLIYIIIVLSFSIGISSGAYTVNELSKSQNEEIKDYIQTFFDAVNTSNISSSELLKTSIFNNIKSAAILWFLGITVIGISLIPIVIGIKGFTTGFTVGFLIKTLDYKGILFSAIAVLPQNIIIIPCYIVLGVICIKFSLYLIQQKKQYGKNDLKTEFIKYNLLILFILLVSMSGSIIETYITPVFIKTVAKALFI